jgi:hypothetical protein
VQNPKKLGFRHFTEHGKERDGEGKRMKRVSTMEEGTEEGKPPPGGAPPADGRGRVAPPVFPSSFGLG